jgi:hypothetical protein
MTSDRGSQRIRGRQWPLFGLLLVTSFLGHDLLMAAYAIGASPSRAAWDHGSASHSTEVGWFALPRHESMPEHLEHCRIGLSAALRGDDPFELADQVWVVSAGVVGAGIADVVRPNPLAWEEPHWPPGIVRAFLHVYRI